MASHCLHHPPLAQWPIAMDRLGCHTLLDFPVTVWSRPLSTAGNPNWPDRWNRENPSSMRTANPSVDDICKTRTKTMQMNKRAQSDRFNCKFYIFMGCFAWNADAMTSVAYVNETRDIYGRPKEEEKMLTANSAASVFFFAYPLNLYTKTMRPKQ